MIAVVAFIASAFIVGEYVRLARTGNARGFHWANALGAVPIAASEVMVHAWPALVLTAFFGAAGWYGVLRRCCADCG